MAQAACILLLKAPGNEGKVPLFAAVDGVKFRGSVTHGQKLVITGRLEDIRPRRIRGYTQGFVDGKMVYEGMITGMWL